jgi:hypothetical protein
MVAKHAALPFAVDAIYTPQRIPQYRGNPFIEALPPALEEDALLESLFSVPEFDIGQREWTTTERLQMIGQLSSFMVPMDRHLQLAQHLDTLMRQGYVGRAPRTAESHRVFTKIYEQQKAGKTFDTSAVQLTAQLSGALVGIPGIGKTTTLRCLFARIPQVIFHRQHNIYQVPYLHIETPYDGASVKGLAESIFRKLDALLPDADYGKQYSNQRSGAETLMNHAARVLHMHAVGLLVVDELQNLENSPKNHEALMTLLVSASNELGVPILFVGTNKAQNLLSQDFRQARRTTGIASTYWGALQKGSAEEPSEWEDFMSVLWRFQWVRQASPLSSQLSDLMFHHSQGVTDIAIKLFAIAQARAIYDGTETLTAALIESVAQNELARVMPMIEAIRRDDICALAAYRDIAPIGLDALLAGVSTKFSGRKVRGVAITGDSPMFAPTVAEALTTVGFELPDAQALAAKVADSSNVLEGVQKALRHATTGKAIKSPTKAKMAAPVTYPPGDYRNGLLQENTGQSVLERLKTLNMIPDINTILSM